MITERTRLSEERAVHTAFLYSPPGPAPPDAHLQSVALPGAVEQHTALLRVWAAVSTPALILGIGVMLTPPTPLTLSGFATLLVLVAGVEAVARHRVRLLTVLAGLALCTCVAVGLVFALLGNWQVVLAGLLAVTALVLLVLNMQELLAPPGRRGHRVRPGPTSRRRRRPLTASLA